MNLTHKIPVAQAIELVPLSQLTRREQLVYDRTPSTWGDPLKVLIAIEDLSEKLGVTRNEAARLVLAHNAR